MHKSASDVILFANVDSMKHGDLQYDMIRAKMKLISRLLHEIKNRIPMRYRNLKTPFIPNIWI